MTALGVLVLSFDALLIRLIHVPAFDLLFWRGLLLSVVGLAWCRYALPSRGLPRLDWPLFRSAFFFVMSTICFVSAINLTSAANVLVIISAQPLFAAVMSRIFLKEKTAVETWIAIGISMAGIAWVLSDSWHGPNLTGDLLALVCGLGLSGKFVNDRASGSRNMTPSLIFAGAAIAAVSLVAGDPLSLQGAAWIWMIILCVGVIPLAFILITLGPMRISAAEVGMLMLLETATGPLWIWLCLNEAPGRRAVEGGIVVVTTLLIHGWIKWRKQRAVAAG